MELTDESFLKDEYHFAMAGNGKRLANYFIDLFIFYIIAILFFAVLAIVNPGSRVFSDNPSQGEQYLLRLISMVFYGIIMGIIEGLFKGRTLGKLITGTKAVNEDGTSIDFMTGFKRGLSRMVPFEAFSALGSPCYPWHDKWTNTQVVVLKDSILPEG
ncbi:RDD family protein [Chitinophaga sp. 212800010-3]|uniref:RDD family protein n=1 Tax=unclassified Chitinophaga TaxID=2619133 RepID=UPI002DE498DA|nr:putative membrane protein YckC, RDD family [Chitinophaga sp. 212800010-3]